jgi:hypothetical protein
MMEGVFLELSTTTKPKCIPNDPHLKPDSLSKMILRGMPEGVFRYNRISQSIVDSILSRNIYPAEPTKKVLPGMTGVFYRVI